MHTEASVYERFDRWQFYRRPKAISAKTGISYQDYTGMSSYRVLSSFRAENPVWTSSTKRIAMVLKAIGWSYIHGSSKPDFEIPIEKLQREIAAKIRRNTKRAQHKDLTEGQRELILRHAAHCNGAGGYLGLYARIIWLAYRLGYDAKTIAQELNISHNAVRAHLCRINKVARKLWPEMTPALNQKVAIFKPRHLKLSGSIRAFIPKPKRQRYFCDVIHVLELRERGHTWQQVAQEVGAGRMTCFRAYQQIVAPVLDRAAS